LRLGTLQVSRDTVIDELIGNEPSADDRERSGSSSSSQGTSGRQQLAASNVNGAKTPETTLKRKDSCANVEEASSSRGERPTKIIKKGKLYILESVTCHSFLLLY